MPSTTTTPSGTARKRGGVSPQSRWIPGSGQAGALLDAAAARGKKPGTNLPWSRADLIREIAHWGLSRPIAEVRAQGPVPAVPNSAPVPERSVTWVPEPGLLAKLDKQASRAGTRAPGPGRPSGRNELLRRHVAAWLANQQDAQQQD